MRVLEGVTKTKQVLLLTKWFKRKINPLLT